MQKETHFLYEFTNWLHVAIPSVKQPGEKVSQLAARLQFVKPVPVNYAGQVARMRCDLEQHRYCNILFDELD